MIMAKLLAYTSGYAKSQCHSISTQKSAQTSRGEGTN